MGDSVNSVVQYQEAQVFVPLGRRGVFGLCFSPSLPLHHLLGPGKEERPFIGPPAALI